MFKKAVKLVCVGTAVVGAGVASASAQITNTPDAIATQVTASAGPSFDKGIVIAVAALTIIVAIRYVMKAVRAR